jgi:hypothetical protein
MDQQHEQGTSDSRPAAPTVPASRAGQAPAGDATNWGEGAATALDKLRSEDFRGRRSRRPAGDGRPSSE